MPDLATSTSPATIRQGGPADAEACAGIVNDWIDDTPWMPRIHTRDEIRAFVRKQIPERVVLVAERDCVVTGYLTLTPDDIVFALYVARSERGRGTGKTLMDAAKAARPGGLTLWAFRHNLGARRFYAREGFVEIRRTDGDNEEGLPDILFGWSAESAP